MKKEVLKEALQKACTYEEFMKIMEENANGGDERVVLNLQRSRRIYKTGQLPDSLQEVVRGITRPQTWLVITEDWCGDSAQTLPFLARLAAQNDQIRLQIVARDEHPEVMALYLTNGKQSIPKWIVLDEALNELGVWGPRPQPAVLLVQEGLAAGRPKPEVIKALHAWYARDKGKTFLSEVEELLKKAQ